VAANSCQSFGTPFSECDAAILEVDLGAEHEIFHRPRYKDLARCRACGDPGADVNSDPSEIVTPEFAFPRVDAGAYLKA
jgi:hypothetical protein